ncbi:hypothetical protein E4U41_000873 [Claviceps citrina]|nr:hypothetical protein E4U41_000873 [Claviceps citrina]
MVRVLPWKKRSDDAKAEPTSASVSGFNAPRRMASPSHVSPATTNARPRDRDSIAGGRRVRSPTNSPKPTEPPAEQFMTPLDDKYRMVEDELLYTARRFTTHLHRAEYTRLEALTRSRNADAIREMERPVVPGGRATVRARQRREMALRDRKQRDGVTRRRRQQQQKQGDELPWVGTSLQGLMEETAEHDGRGGGRAMRIGLVGSGDGSAPRTRAAAGFVSRGMAGGPAVTRAPSGVGVAVGGGKRVGGDADVQQEEGDDDEDEDDGDDDDPFGVYRRRAGRRQSREQQRRRASGKETTRTTPPTRTPDTIPSFL